jgi:hypothetical protein
MKCEKLLECSSVCFSERGSTESRKGPPDKKINCKYHEMELLLYPFMREKFNVLFCSVWCIFVGTKRCVCVLFLCISAAHWHPSHNVCDVRTFELIVCLRLLLGFIYDMEIAGKYLNKGYISLCKFMAVLMSCVCMLCIILFLCLIFFLFVLTFSKCLLGS